MRSNVKRIDTRRAHSKSRKDSPRSESSSGALIGRKKSTLSNILSCRALNSFGVLIALVLFLAVMVTLLVTEPTAHASNPSSGTLTLTSSSLTWKGTAIGGGAQNDLGLGVFGAEDLCQEGITCDTYTLTISGAPADWANAKKLVHVHLGWTIPTQDFDLYIHKGDLSGPVVANSGSGATNGVLTSEDADLDPSSPSVGTGTFAVHVVYWAGEKDNLLLPRSRGESDSEERLFKHCRSTHEVISVEARSMTCIVPFTFGVHGMSLNI